MDDKQKRRLNRQFAVTWFLLLVMILVALFLATSRPRVESHNFVGAQGPKGESIAGPMGPPGESIKGEKGDPGQTTVIESNTTVYRTETVQGEKGEPGEKGEQGVPGQDAPALQLQVNPVTKDLEYRYSGDTAWSLLIPCIELLKECDDGNVTE